MQIGINITVLFQIVLFLSIVLIVNKLIVKPIHSTYTKRDGKISALNAKTQTNLDEIEIKKLEYEARLQAVRADITEYHNQLKSKAAAKAQAIIDKAKSEAQARINDKRREIDAQAATARESLKKDVANFSEQILSVVTKQ